MREQILQTLIDGGGKYFLAERYIQGFNHRKDTWEALIIAPDVPRDLWGKKIMEMPYKEVVKFADAEIKSTIHLGKSYQPFQYGIHNKDFISLKEITCPPMELVVKCYQEDEKDYHKIVKIMENLTPSHE